MATKHNFSLRYDPTLYPISLKQLNTPRLRAALRRALDKIREDAYSGRQLHGNYRYLWHVRVGKKFRLYYEIWKKKKIAYLRVLAPRNLQTQTLRRLSP